MQIKRFKSFEKWCDYLKTHDYHPQMVRKDGYVAKPNTTFYSGDEPSMTGYFCKVKGKGEIKIYEYV